MMRKGVSSSISQEKISINLNQPANALCANRDGTRIAVVGRKIFMICDTTDQLKELYNLRNLPQKSLNLNYSSNHVQWNPRDENQLATAPTNSSVVLWDLNKKSKSKLSHVYEEFHQRAVNRVCYHPREANLLLSGSQDCTMVCFDTRQKTFVSRYTGPDSVRDVQYNHHNDYYFAACFENGSCQLWDRRHTDSAVKSINAHGGPAYSCAWALEQEHRVVTAGRDKMIKVHDTQASRAKELFTINALFSVARVRWRPSNKSHLTSCSHLLDSTVALWDVRRPFIQYATFSEHNDVVTDFLWLSEDVLVSCAKDSHLVLQNISDAGHLTDRATPVSISFKPNGSLSASCSDITSQRSKTHTSANTMMSRNPIQFRSKHEVDPYQQTFLCHTSYLQEHTTTEEKWWSDFKKCAQSFQIEGSPIDKLCDINYQVCLDCNKNDAARSWLLLKLLYCGNDPHCSTLGLNPLMKARQYQLINSNNNNENINENSEKTSSIDQSGSVKERASQPPTEGESSTAVTDDDTQDFSEVLEFFGYNEDDSDSSTSGSASHTHHELELPKEPFQLRQEITHQSNNLLEVPEIEQGSSHSGPISFASSGGGRRSSITTLHSQKQLPPGLTPPTWNFSDQVINLLEYYASKGDVQMSVTVVLVFGECISKLIDELILLQWFHSYIDLLTQYKLLNEAVYITKHCPLKQIKETSLSSTMYNIGCGKCNRAVGPGTVMCSKCETTLNICSVCHTPVKGLYSLCEVCGHGGHLSHLKTWFSNHSWCPYGCGHHCTS